MERLVIFLSLNKSIIRTEQSFDNKTGKQNLRPNFRCTDIKKSVKYVDFTFLINTFVFYIFFYNISLAGIVLYEFVLYFKFVTFVNQKSAR